MGKTYINGVNIPTGFNHNHNQPYDSRIVLDTFSDLLLDIDTHVPTAYLYKWIKITTNDTGVEYKWNGEDRSKAENWIPAAENRKVESNTVTGDVSFDLDTFNVSNSTLVSDVTSLKFSNGKAYEEYVINLSKDVDGRSLTISNDYLEANTYGVGDVVGVSDSSAVLSRVYYKANQEITVPELFDDAKWDLFIKTQDDVSISLSYQSSIIDRLLVTPMLQGVVKYYSVIPIYNIGVK